MLTHVMITHHWFGQILVSKPLFLPELDSRSEHGYGACPAQGREGTALKAGDASGLGPFPLAAAERKDLQLPK